MMVSAKVYHTMALNTDGQLFVWGDNSNGQLGLGTNANKSTPTHIDKSAFGDSDVLTFNCGPTHTLVVTTPHCSLYAFGSGRDGKLGHGDCYSSLLPRCIGAEHFSNQKITRVSAGCNHSAVVTEDGQLFVWGCSSATGLLFDSFSPVLVPQAVTLGARVGCFFCLPEAHALAFAMGLHVRVGAGCKYLILDDGIIRIIIELCAARPADRICKLPGLRRMLGGGLMLP